jgi:CheY-like chemotaxis protein
VIFITENKKLTDEMIKYEEATGKKAIWHGAVTEGFKKWQRGEEIYGIDKKGIGLLVSDETKAKWQNFADMNEFPTVSKLIRKAVDFYIDFQSNKKFLRDIATISHDLKEPLTSIQGFSQLIIEIDSDELKPDILSKIKEIYAQSLFLENKINEIISDKEPESSHYDILIIEDDLATLSVLIDFFESKRLLCKGVITGTKGLEELSRIIPKIILLDIILPDIDGYEICKKIKSDEKLKHIPVFYITAIPESDVVQRLEETGADGYFLKPFKFPKFKILFDYI